MKIRFEGGLFWGARQQPFTRSMTRHVDRHNEAESTPGPGITGRMTGSAGHGTIANRRLLCRPFDQRITGWETAASSGVPIVLEAETREVGNELGPFTPRCEWGWASVSARSLVASRRAV